MVSVEQHGHHLPLDVDLVCPLGVAHGAGREIPDKMLVLPILALDLWAWSSAGWAMPVAACLATLAGQAIAARAATSRAELETLRIVGMADGGPTPSAWTSRDVLQQVTGNATVGTLAVSLAARGPATPGMCDEAAHAPRVGQDLAFGDAHTRFVRIVIVCGQKLHRVRGDHRQVQASGQLHRLRHVAGTKNHQVPPLDVAANPLDQRDTSTLARRRNITQPQKCI